MSTRHDSDVISITSKGWQPRAGHGRAPALRVQLIAGLALILLVLATSTGMIAHWSARQQLAGSQLRHARVFAEAVASVLAVTLAEKEPGRVQAELRQAVAALAAGPGWGHLEIFSRELVLLGAAGRLGCPALSRDLLRRAIRTERQLVRLIENPAGIEVVAPVYRGGTLEVQAALRLCLPLAEQGAWPLLSFWIMMAVDSLALLLFVGIVVTRYVTHPLGRLREAAARVAAGDLTARLDETGSAEMASLAASFNSMTMALQQQLDQLQRQQRSLVQSEKLASVGRLAAGIAHEVGNPLQSIIGFTDLLIEQQVDEAERDDFLRRIQGESQRIHGTLRELLDYSRPGGEALEQVSLALVVEDALSLVQHTPRFRGVEVKVDPLDLVLAQANAGRLVQVLVNLLLNAADALEGQGTVSIGGGCDDAFVWLRIANSGPPIAASERDLIFDPFYTTKQPGEGTGLGLAVALSIVESFGGQLSLAAESSPTTFVVRLPRS